MFDSLYIKCPKCGKELEIQSKSGPCALFSYTKSNLPPEVAVGLNGDIIECEFCKTNFEVKCNIPKRVQVKLVPTKKRADYSGNYNPELPKNKRALARFKKMLNKNNDKEDKLKWVLK